MTIAFRDSAGIFGNVPTGRCQLTIPATVQAGDLLVLGYIADCNSGDAGGQGVIADPTGVTGWTPLAAQSSLASSVAKAWWKIAAAPDAGAVVTVLYGTDTVNQWGGLVVGAWSGVNASNPIPVISSPATSATTSATHVMPTINTVSVGSAWVGSLWMGREGTSSTSYAVSSGWTVRESNLRASVGNPNAAIIDSGAPVAGGSAVGGATITGDQAALNNFAFTFSIAPALVTQTARPVTDVTTAGWTPSATLGGGVQESTLVADGLDTTYVTSSASPVSQVWEARLPTLAQAPDSFTNRIEFGGGAVSGTVVGQLIQNTTVIATRTDTFSSGGTPCPTTPTDLTHTLSGGEKAAITDLTNLRIRCTVTAA